MHPILGLDQRPNSRFTVRVGVTPQSPLWDLMVPLMTDLRAGHDTTGDSHDVMRSRLSSMHAAASTQRLLPSRRLHLIVPVAAAGGCLLTPPCPQADEPVCAHSSVPWSSQ